jgi:opacity protein-like surface antigen
MKKIILSSLWCLGLSTIATAQFTFGVEAGATSTKIRSIDNDPVASGQTSKYTADGGFYIGGLASYNPSKEFSVQSGLRYVAIKGKETTTYAFLPGATLNGTVSLNYLEIPLNFVLKTDRPKGNWMGYFGPQFGFALSGKAKATLTGQPNINESLKFGNKDDQYKRMHISMGLGIGHNITKNVQATLGYHFGVNDIDNSKDFETKFNSLRIGLRYIFN